jgi:hypothetical protein
MTYSALAGLLFGLVACSVTSRTPAERHRIPCDHGACPYAHTCRYQRVDGQQRSECQLEVGRCYSDWDCAPASQHCQRFNADPGTCVMAGL